MKADDINSAPMTRTFSVLERSGLARLADLESAQHEELFQHLEQYHAKFAQESPRFLSPEYAWPRDPLHSWSRVWEYPYVLHHLTAFRDKQAGRPQVADIGSGLTFFPFAVADLGYDVICCDIDPIVAVDLPKAAKVIPHKNDVTFRLISGDRLPFADEELDAIYCISVLEHIPNFENTVAEMFRCLKWKGVLILTIDISLKGPREITPENRARLARELDSRFQLVLHDDVPLSEALLSTNGPYQLHPVGAQLLKFRAKQAIKSLLGRAAHPVEQLAVEGMVLIKTPDRSQQELAGLTKCSRDGHSK